MASLRSSVILAVICLVSGAASAAIQNETRLSEVEEQKSNCRKTDPGYKTSTDDIDKFNENYVIASIVGGTHKDEETLCSMKITWKTAVRFFKWTEVYDGQAEVSPGNPNIDPGYTVVVRHFDSYEQAKEKAIDGLVDHLTKLGLINEQPCYVGPYPDSLVNIDPTGKQCPPNSNVSACTECTFHCTNEADVDFDKTTTVRCCGNGHFDREIMPCDGRPRTLTSPRPQTTTSSVEPQSNCRTSSGYYTDGGSIGGFNENCIVANLIPGGKHTSEESLCGVEITWRTCARIDKIPSDIVVYDGQAEISDTGADTPYTVIVRGKETYAEARRNAIDALVDHLTSIGYIKEKPCYVGHYPNSLVNIGDKHNKCPPNSPVSACTECTFHCTNEADADFDKTTTIRCCGNGHFDDEMPSCKATAATTTTTTTATTTAATTTTTTTATTTAATTTTTAPTPPPSTTSSTTTTATSTTSTMSPSWTVVASSTYAPTNSSRGTSKITMVTNKCDPSTGDCHVTMPTNSTSGKDQTEDNGKMLFLLIPAALFALSCAVVWWRKRVNSKRGYSYRENKVVIRPSADGHYNHCAVIEARPTADQLNFSEVYKMDSEVKGLVFVLNNVTSTDAKIRDGSKVDAENIVHVFSDIGYEPVVKSNLSSVEIHSALNHLKDCIESNHTSLVIAISAHGNDTEIVGNDGSTMRIQDIKDMFSFKNCAILRNKPKIFFIQTIREGAKASPCIANSPDVRSPAHVRPDVEADGFVVQNEDMFVVQITIGEYFSIQSGVPGLWFIQALCEELLASAHRDSLDRIMTHVTRRVGELIGIDVAIQPPQIIKEGISKHIFFLPKYVNNLFGYESLDDDEDVWQREPRRQGGYREDQHLLSL